MSNISFKNESKHIPGFPLNKIETVGNFQYLNNDHQIKQERLDKIDYYYSQKDDIFASQKGLGLSKTASRIIKEPEIAAIYLLVTGKKKKNELKNDMIGEIMKFYKEQYVPRINRDQSNNTIIISDSNTSKSDNIYNTMTNQRSISSPMSDSEEDSDIDI